MVLVFGCRAAALDHIYQEEMEEAQEQGALSQVLTAFSRQPGTPKVGWDQGWDGDRDGNRSQDGMGAVMRMGTGTKAGMAVGAGTKQGWGQEQTGMGMGIGTWWGQGRWQGWAGARVQRGSAGLGTRGHGATCQVSTP